MSLTVNEVWHLKEMESFDLVAGKQGLDNKIKGIGVLDYEFGIRDGEFVRNYNFRKYDFVISSLLFAKDHPELLLPTVQALHEDRVSALAIKTVVFHELPKEVIQYADEHNLPVFMFGRDDAYFEDIITLLKNKIKERSNFDFFEHEISLFIHDELETKAKRELNRKILKDRIKPYYILYIRPNEAEEEKTRDIRRLFSFNKENESNFYYKKGCLHVYYIDQNVPLEDSQIMRNMRAELEALLRTPVDHYQIGISELHDDAEEELVYALKEAICAYRYARLYGLEKVSFHSMGIYRLALPLYKTKWYKDYCRSIIDKILEADRMFDGELFETAKTYMQNFGDITRVSEEMHVHKNTIRYRMKKIREILNLEEDQYFDMELSLAFLLDELERRFPEEM